MNCSTPGLSVHHQLPESTQTHVHWVADDIEPSHPLSSPSPPALNLSKHQGLFKWVSSSHQWLKYWSFSFSISPSSEYSGLISFRMDWLELLAAQRAFKSLLQHHSSKASILWHSAFFMVHLTLYMTTGKNIALTRWIFVGKVMSLLFSNNRLVPNRKRSTSRLILSPCLFNLYAEYIMRNAGLEDAQAGIKIARRNINNLRYADDTTLMAEGEE